VNDPPFPSIPSLALAAVLALFVGFLSVAFGLMASTKHDRPLVAALLALSTSVGLAFGTRLARRQIGAWRAGELPREQSVWLSYAAGLGSVVGVILVQLVMSSAIYWVLSTGFFGAVLGAVATKIPFLVKQRRRDAPVGPLAKVQEPD
jgi:uncharacterized membrane protein YfcA